MDLHVVLRQKLLRYFFNLLSKAIRRLTLEDVQLIEDVSDVLNKVFTKGEIMEEMIQELRVFQKNARKWEELCQSEGKANQIMIYKNLLTTYCIYFFYTDKNIFYRK